MADKVGASRRNLLYMKEKQAVNEQFLSAVQEKNREKLLEAIVMGATVEAYREALELPDLNRDMKDILMDHYWTAKPLH